MEQRVVGQYRLEEEFGRGSFGVVHRGVHVSLPALQAAVSVSNRCLGAADIPEAVQEQATILGFLAEKPVKVAVRPLAGGSPGQFCRLLQGTPPIHIAWVPVFPAHSSAEVLFDARLPATDPCSALGARLADPVIRAHAKPEGGG